jgi:small subunit ribosomal protein S21
MFMTSPLEVEVNGDIEKAFKNLKKKMAFEGIFKELKRRRYYEKPSEEKKRKKEEAERRRLKKMRRMSMQQGRVRRSTSRSDSRDHSQSKQKNNS